MTTIPLMPIPFGYYFELVILEIMRVAITLTSSLDVGQQYIDLTREVANMLAKEGDGIVYGGTAYGMMLTLGESYKAAGGKDLSGVMAKDLRKVTKNYVAFDGLDHTYWEKTMENRKRKIVKLADAFLILPGGWGTIEEIGTIVGGKANKLFDRPIAFYNYNGFYDTLLKFFAEIYDKRFSRVSLDQLLLASTDMAEILAYFKTYRGVELADKFVPRPTASN